MRIVVLQCGCDVSVSDTSLPADSSIAFHSMPAVPTRKDLAFLCEIASEELPVDTSPTTDDIAKSKEVPHLGSPRFAPQTPAQPVRVIVIGPDAALGAVVTFLMRRNLLWFDVAHVPDAPSAATRNWGISGSGEYGLLLEDAVSKPVRPVPLIRDDTGHAVVGYALLTETGIEGLASDMGLVGEVYVDEHCLFSGTSNGVQIRPTAHAPGLVAAEVPWQQPKKRWSLFRAHRSRELHSPIEGRAVQAGGPGFRYVRDGIEAKKPRDKVTIYRHLLDLQLVR